MKKIETVKIHWRDAEWHVDCARTKLGLAIYSLRRAGERDAQTFAADVGEHQEVLGSLDREEWCLVVDLVAAAMSRVCA